MKIAIALTLLTAASSLTAQTNKNPLAVHQSAIVIDTHADTTQRLLDEEIGRAHV